MTQSSEPSIAVLFHSGYGHTAAVAQRVANGAGAGARLVTIDAEGNLTDEDWQALDAADAIVFGAPTYMGNVSWQFKKVADATSGRWMAGAWKDKIFGGFTNSASPSGDKQVSLIAMQTFASQHGGIWISLGIPPANQKASSHDDLNHLGGSVGAMIRSPADAAVEEIFTGDLATAETYGRRIADFAERLRPAA